MKLGSPIYTILGILLCGLLAVSHARGWLIYSGAGSARTGPPGPRGAGFFHK